MKQSYTKLLPRNRAFHGHLHLYLYNYRRCYCTRGHPWFRVSPDCTTVVLRTAARRSLESSKLTFTTLRRIEVEDTDAVQYSTVIILG